MKNYELQKKIAVGLATLIMAGSTVACMPKNSGQSTSTLSDTTTTSDDNILNDEIAFDVNSEVELVNRIADAYQDFLAKGVIVSVDDLIDLFTVLNLRNIDPTKYIPLQNEQATMESILAGADNVLNTLLDDAMTSDSNNVPNLASLIADPVSAKIVNEFQQAIAKYNTSTDKTKAAAEVNKLIDKYFVRGEYKDLENGANIAILRFLKGMEILTINNGKDRIPAKKYSNYLFGNGESCDFSSKANDIKSIVGIERTDLKSELKEKKDVSIQKDDAEDMHALYVELVAKIVKELQSRQLIYLRNPDLLKKMEEEKARYTTKDKYDTVGPNDIIVTDKDGNKIIIVPPTNEESQKESIASSIEKENNEAEAIGLAKQAGAQDGYNKGLADGRANRPKDPTYTYNGKYEQYYIEYFEKYYDKGYKQGQEDYNRQQNYTTSTEFKPVTDEPTQSTTSSATTKSTTSQTTTTTTATTTTNSIIELADGYYADSNGYVFDENGNPVIDPDTGKQMNIYTMYMPVTTNESSFARTAQLNSYKDLKASISSALYNYNQNNTPRGVQRTRRATLNL